MFTLWGRKKTTAAPVVKATSSVAVAEPQAPVAVELPPLVVVKRDFATPQRPRSESDIFADIEALRQTIVDATASRDTTVAGIEAEKTDNLQRAANATAGLLAIEGALKDKINTQRDAVERTLNARIATADKELATFVADQNAKIRNLEIEHDVRDLDAQYPRIDMSFLDQVRPATEKVKLQLPKFGLFTLDSPTCTLQATAQYHDERSDRLMTTPVLFGTVAKLTAVRQYARQLVRSHRCQRAIVTLTATFSGAIPPAIRESLATATRSFQCVYLVNEPEWQLDKELVPFPPAPDPLVIGSRHGIHWLIASFDTTPAEEYIRREFTEGKLTDQRV